MQDERLFSLEQETDAIDGQLDGISAEIEGTNPFDPCFVRHSFFNYVFLQNIQCLLYITDLQDATVALEFRVTVLEENGGNGGNSSVAELEVRVESLEVTAADHETRISATELDVNGKPYQLYGRLFS